MNTAQHHENLKDLPRTQGRPAALPPGLRVYAIGDLHGNLGGFERMVAAILADAKDAAEPEKVMVFVGDYVDRGGHSRQVIDRICQLQDSSPDGFEVICLQGNHEAMMLDFLQDPRGGETWIANGGDTTLASYGLGSPPRWPDDKDLSRLSRGLHEALSGRQRQFFRDLRLSHVAGDYLFVHAGIRPGVALNRQSPQDLMWIRGPFLTSDDDFGHVVVHGHTNHPQPQVKHNRIGIDIGVYKQARLAGLALNRQERRPLIVQADP